MKAAVLNAIGDLRIQEVPVPVPVPGSVLVRVRACGVCGSDIPRIFTKGTYRFPLIPGHEFAGEVVAAASRADERFIGQRVAVFPLIPCKNCLSCETGAYAQCESYDYLGSRSDGAFAEYVTVPTWNLLPCPAALSWEEAAMAEPLAVALHALARGSFAPGESVCVAGAGPIGLLIALAAQRGGASHVILSDIDPAKLDAARTLGIEHLVDARTTTPDVFAHDLCRGADLVIEATGSTNGYEKCILSAKTFGRVVLLGNPLAAMNLPQSSYWVILRKELQVTGSWNSVYRYCGDNDWTKALQMMASGFPAIKLVTHRVGLEELSAALRMMRDRTDFFTKVVCIP